MKEEFAKANRTKYQVLPGENEWRMRTVDVNHQRKLVLKGKAERELIDGELRNNFLENTSLQVSPITVDLRVNLQEMESLMGPECQPSFANGEVTISWLDVQVDSDR